MTTPTDQQPDANHYLRHLCRLNDTQEVTASEDIYNQFGVLLIAKGSRINPQTQTQLNQHRLKKSLDGQIALQSTLTDELIFQRALKMLEKSPELWSLHCSNRFEAPFRHLCLSENLPLQVRQKLTVMDVQLPDLFEHCLFTGWAAALIAKEIGLKPDICKNAYTCGLLHDIGLLHISADVQTPLSEDNWRALQSHVVIGQRYADDCGLEKSIGRGILEHHERLDCTGYPARKAANKLGLLGQLISSADLLHSLCTNELSRSRHSMHDALPYFKIHRGSFNEAIHSAIIRLLSRTTSDQLDQDTDIPPVNLQRVRDTNIQLKALWLPLLELSQQASICAQPEWLKVSTMMVSIIGILNESGLDDELLSSWLITEMDLDDQANQLDLKEIDAMQYELLWLFKRLGWNLQCLIDAHETPESSASTALAAYHTQLNEQLEQAFSRYLEPKQPSPSSLHEQEQEQEQEQAPPSQQQLANAENAKNAADSDPKSATLSE